jgi:hypothetical protein
MFFRPSRTTILKRFADEVSPCRDSTTLLSYLGDKGLRKRLIQFGYDGETDWKLVLAYLLDANPQITTAEAIHNLFGKR